MTGGSTSGPARGRADGRAHRPAVRAPTARPPPGRRDATPRPAAARVPHTGGVRAAGAGRRLSRRGARRAWSRCSSPAAAGAARLVVAGGPGAPEAVDTRVVLPRRPRVRPARAARAAPRPRGSPAAGPRCSSCTACKSNPPTPRSSPASTALSDRDGVYVAYPEGVRDSFDAGLCCGPAVRYGVDDVAFLARVVADLRSRGASRVSVVGFSNGGMMAYRLRLRAARPRRHRRGHERHARGAALRTGRSARCTCTARRHRRPAPRRATTAPGSTRSCATSPPSRPPRRAAPSPSASSARSPTAGPTRRATRVDASAEFWCVRRDGQAAA